MFSLHEFKKDVLLWQDIKSTISGLQANIHIEAEMLLSSYYIEIISTQLYNLQ